MKDDIRDVHRFQGRPLLQGSCHGENVRPFGVDQQVSPPPEQRQMSFAAISWLEVPGSGCIDNISA
jgi:hypothetical protein